MCQNIDNYLTVVVVFGQPIIIGIEYTDSLFSSLS